MCHRIWVWLRWTSKSKTPELTDKEELKRDNTLLLRVFDRVSDASEHLWRKLKNKEKLR